MACQNGLWIGNEDALRLSPPDQRFNEAPSIAQKVWTS
jgi:hypothetical protein